jgi:hypothetical protein
MLPMFKDLRTRHFAALAWSGTALTVAVTLTIALRFAPIAAVPVIAFFILILAIAGLAAFGIDVRAAIKDTHSAAAALARAAGSFAILASGAVLFLPCMLVTSIIVIWATLVANCSTYAMIVEEAQRGVITPNAIGYNSAHGIRFQFVSSQPVQIVFPINGDMEEGWGAIVYDATSASGTAVSQKGGDALADSIHATFGRARCSAMITRYYRCTFY